VELAGRVALVTGAGRRVGRAIALALGGRRMQVAVHYNASAAGADETVALIHQAGGTARPLRADLATIDAPAALVAAVLQQFGSLAVLVNSAAVMLRTPFGEVSPAEWDAMFALNLRAPFLVSQAAASALAAEHGTIVNIADLAAFETWPAYIPHAITKAGVVKMTESLARRLAPNVRVNAVAPGAVMLPERWSAGAASRLASTTPLRRLGTGADVAQAVIYLLEADYVTGETILVDGGRHVRS
jgi:pteridine reductase